MMDHEEWRNAYLRATEVDIVFRLHHIYEADSPALLHNTAEEAANEIRRLREELIEAKSEIQRLQSIASY